MDQQAITGAWPLKQPANNTAWYCTLESCDSKRPPLKWKKTRNLRGLNLSFTSSFSTSIVVCFGAWNAKVNDYTSATSIHRHFGEIPLLIYLLKRGRGTSLPPTLQHPGRAWPFPPLPRWHSLQSFQICLRRIWRHRFSVCLFILM